MKAIILVLPFLLLFAKPSFAASFDCNKAFTQNEVWVCKDAWLSQIDVEYSKLYKHVRDKTKHDVALYATVKSLAVKALKRRELDCYAYRNRHRLCLMHWYSQGKKRLVSQLKEVEGAGFKKSSIKRIAGYSPPRGYSRPSEAPPIDIKAMERRSLGEIHLNKVISDLTIPVFDSPGGQQIGKMNIGKRKQEVRRLTEVSVWVYDNKYNSIVEPVFTWRNHYDPTSFLVFDISGNWVNVSADPSIPAWIDKDPSSSRLAGLFNTREKVILGYGDGKSVISLMNTHRFRAKPDTSATVLKLLDNTVGYIMPLAIKGNWMKARTIYPEPPYDFNVDEVQNDPQFKVMDGWFYWRKSLDEQMIDSYQLSRKYCPSLENCKTVVERRKK